ncbi:MAG: protein kinase [Deltaproteobacteria bacterium]|nr:protein kinase [Deltaproteobacteria bacterium]MDQ3297864.1 protein kinase [Myxococcota bacterium]
MLARISARPPTEWNKRLEQEFPTDPAMRMQALLWLHSQKEGPEAEGAPPSLGDAADERYELSVRLDSGATASVWQAFDRRLGRNVAIKVFHERGESEALDQVLAEARAASDVISEHVVRVLDVQYGDGHPYMVMELVGEYDADKGEVALGATAAALSPRDLDEVARWVMHVARGVQEAHLRNVFHRDLKPKNVLITPNSRRARVADFGLAVSGASADAAHPAITLMKRGPMGPVSVRGTPEYMAPEQARGLPLTLDARATEDRAVLVAVDVWGLGAIAYELVTGKPPWLARRSDDLSAWEVAASTERPAPLDRSRDGERVSPRLKRIIEKAMAIDPKARYATAAALANELQAFLARRPTTLDRSRLLRIGLWCRRNPQLALTVLVAIGLTGLAAGTHSTVTQLRAQRDELDREVAVQKAEETRLSRRVKRSRVELDETRTKLAAERLNLTALEKSLADERGSYATLIEAKERALKDANAATRQIMHQLEASRRERKAAEDARANLEKVAADARREGEKAAKDRDRSRREREASRAERDAAQRERDAAIAEREATEKQLTELKAELERLASARAQGS